MRVGVLLLNPGTELVSTLASLRIENTQNKNMTVQGSVTLI